MSSKNVKRNILTFAITAGFIIPHAPNMAWAKKDDKDGSSMTLQDLFPSSPNDGGLIKPAVTNNNQKPATKPFSGNGNGKLTMAGAKVPNAYSCPLFENSPHAELISAIDSITQEVQANPECSDSPSVKTLEDSGNTIKASIMSLQALMGTQDPSLVSTAQIDQTMTAALSAIGNIGNVVNNSSFLNSSCGQKTMSTGKILLGLNDVINGFAPYALFAVSMNAALAPALPFVIGGVIATSGISAISKMIDSNTLDMSNPDHRKALLQNTCQYTKVAKKVRFMQLAQSGRIESVTAELQNDYNQYKASFSLSNQPGELTQLLDYKNAQQKALLVVEEQYKKDLAELILMESQISQNNDDMMICTLTNELVNWANADTTKTSFPASAFGNLILATAQGNRAEKLQAAAMNTLNATSMKRITEYAEKAMDRDTALKTCAQTGKSWMTAIRQTIQLTYDFTMKSRNELETQLMQNSQYSQWKMQITGLENKQLTVTRVQKAMEELAKDNSIIDRSELAQRMTILKSGLFGARGSWFLAGKPPVLAWIEHTKSMHDQAIAAMDSDLQTLQSGAELFTPAGKGEAVKFTIYGHMYIDPIVQIESRTASENLSTLTLTNLPVGSRENEIACQQLETAWLDFTAAEDHLGAVKFFCEMVDPVLDMKMDHSVIKACRGDVRLNGQNGARSLVDAAQEVLVQKGFINKASIVSAKLKELQCAMPSVTDMN